MFRKISLYFFVFFNILFLFSCKKEQNPVPFTSVNIHIFNIESDPQYSALRSPLNSVYVSSSNCVGYNCNGVVVFRAKVEGGHDDYKAFDRTCTHEADTCAMEIDSAFPDLLVCPCCGSVFSMIGGYMQQGPAKHPLREYNCDFYDGDLYIR